MSTALATIETGNYLALQDGGAIAEAMQANLGEGAALKESDLTRVSIPSGGATKWTIPSITGDETADAIEGILVYQTVRGVIWLGDEPQEGQLPALVSHDLKTARTVADDLPQDFLDSIEPARLDGGIYYDWTKLPQNEWGSGKNGRGKRAKEQRVLFVLRETEPLPFVVTVQPGSLKNWQQFIVALTKAGVPYWRAVVSLGLEKDKNEDGIAFARIVPTLVGTLDNEQGAEIRARFSTPMAEVANSSFAS